MRINTLIPLSWKLLTPSTQICFVFSSILFFASISPLSVSHQLTDIYWATCQTTSSNLKKPRFSGIYQHTLNPNFEGLTMFSTMSQHMFSESFWCTLWRKPFLSIKICPGFYTDWGTLKITFNVHIFCGTALDLLTLSVVSATHLLNPLMDTWSAGDKEQP